MHLNVTRQRSLAIGSILLVFLLPLSVACAKYFAVDEFLYAHWGWLVSIGQRPGVDFSVTHFPLIAYLAALPFRLTGSDPTAIWYLRWIMAAFFALLCISAWAINARISASAGFLAPLFLCLNAALIISITEIRPDSLAIALFLTASALLLRKGMGWATLYFCAGVLLVLSELSSEKALIYGPAILIACWLKLRATPAEEKNKIALQFYLAAAGAVMTIAAVLIYLVHGRQFHPLVNSWWSFARLHEQSYSSSRWKGLELLAYFGVQQPVLTLLAGWAVIRIVGIRGTDSARKLYSDPGLAFLLALLALSAVSLAIQKAPYRYSQIPVAVAISMLAAVGLNQLYEIIKALQPGRLRSFLVLGCSLALAEFVVANIWSEAALARRGNGGQLETLRLLANISNSSDCVYDNSGGAIARPHAHDQFYQTDNVMRGIWGDRIQSEIPVAIRDRGCALMLEDTRTKNLPPQLRAFLAESYYSYTDDISVWGKSFASQDSAGHSDSFFAVASGNYFVWPLEAATRMSVAIDGAELKSQTFTLEKGDHAVQFNGAGSFYILWLPRNTEPFPPKFNVKSDFSILH